MSTQPMNAEALRFTLGDRIRKALHASDIKAQDLAEKMGVKRLTVSRWVNDAVEPSLTKVRQIAVITGVPYEWLLTGHLNETPPTPGGVEGESHGAPGRNRTGDLLFTRSPFTVIPGGACEVVPLHSERPALSPAA